jgi:flagellar protein FlaG
MAIEALSGAACNDAAKIVPRQQSEQSVQKLKIADINLTEIPVMAIKTTQGSQTDKEQNGAHNQKVPGEQVKDAINKVNSKMKANRTRCEFVYHEEVNRVSIKVLDRETEEVIKEIPPEKTLEMLEKAWELAGLLVDERR